MTREPLIWIDGIHAAPGALHLSALDRGFTLADGLFETIRIANGVPFRLGSHLGRLRASARRVGLPLPTGLPRTVEDAARDAADAGIRDAGLRLTISRGVGSPGLAPPATVNPTCVIAITERQALPDESALGLAAVTASGRRNEQAMTAGLKTLSYTDSVLALAEARAAGADEALLLDTEGHLSEASASNLFLVLRGVLHTPPSSCAALPGITRAVVIEIADTMGLVIDERPLWPLDLHEAAEAFLTSSLRGIAPLRSIDGRLIGGGEPGQVTRQLTAQYLALIQEECAGWPSAAE